VRKYHENSTNQQLLTDDVTQILSAVQVMSFTNF